MKKHSTTSRVVTIFVTTIALACTAVGSSGNYFAHEWGTFTSLQGADGSLITWKPLETSALPGFVYSSVKPGLNRRITSPLGGIKGAMLTLQRMETPVIYFYTDTEQTIDVRVKFPNGLITEWYPQAKKIGPSMAVSSDADVAAHHALISMMPSFIPSENIVASNEFTSAESLIHWPEVKLIPAKKQRDLQLPFEKSGNHYFAARETDSAFVRLNAEAAPEVKMEQEKFLFYRGVGSFKTPLRVTISSSGAVTLRNQGAETLAHLFFINVENGAAKFIHIQKLEPNASRTVEPPSFARGGFRLKKAQEEISAEMQRALVSEGLFPREAASMVNTWKDSWFTENGWRVLYTLPRKWTDELLPLDLNPAPAEIVRVMVGRAELIPPTVEAELVAQIKNAIQGGATTLPASLKKLGRFSEAIFHRAVSQVNPGDEDRAKLNKIFQEIHGSLQQTSATFPRDNVVSVQ